MKTEFDSTFLGYCRVCRCGIFRAKLPNGDHGLPERVRLLKLIFTSRVGAKTSGYGVSILMSPIMVPTTHGKGKRPPNPYLPSLVV